MEIKIIQVCCDGDWHTIYGTGAMWTIQDCIELYNHMNRNIH